MKVYLLDMQIADPNQLIGMSCIINHKSTVILCTIYLGYMFLKHGPKKLGTQPLGNTIMSSVVLVVHVYSQCLRGRGFMITEMAGVGLDSQLYCFHMPIQISC